MALYTIERLQSLKPNEACVYYRGNFSTDIVNSDGAYALLLARIEDAAAHLEKAGKIQRVSRELSKPKPNSPTQLEYTAIGRR